MINGKVLVLTPSNRCLSDLHLDLLAFAALEGICFSTVASDKVARDELVRDGLLSESWLITVLGYEALNLARWPGQDRWYPSGQR